MAGTLGVTNGPAVLCLIPGPALSTVGSTDSGGSGLIACQASGTISSWALQKLLVGLIAELAAFVYHDRLGHIL